MICQIVIALCGIASVWLSQSPAESSRRWAPVIGLVGQPAWLISSYDAAQWGIFVLSIVYAIGWARGIRTYWIIGRATR